MTGMVRDMTPDAARMKKAAGEGYATATDLADWLVRTLNMPFREAHHVTGRIVATAARPACRSTSCRSRPCRLSSRGSPRPCSRCCRSSARSSRMSLAARRPQNVRREAKKWLQWLGEK